jgi:osmotically-inducible protein OsmY
MAKQIQKSDAQIQQDVLRELKWDTRVEETEVGVEVDRGVVTLSGTVSDWAKRLAAQEAAHRVLGVMDVANDIQVQRRGARTDTEIAHAVRQTLEWNVLVPDERIRTTVSNGVVTLEGEVDNLIQREDAERAVRDLDGVRSVNDRIRIHPPPVSTEIVRSAIEAALERYIEREGRRIQLDVHDGRVTLSGSVRTWAERQAAVGAARGTPGVREVDDRLKLEPFA